MTFKRHTAAVLATLFACGRCSKLRDAADANDSLAVFAAIKAGADVNAKLGEEWSEKDTSALYRAVERCVEIKFTALSS